MHANLLEVFSQRDRALRWAAMVRIYADDIRWTDDDGVTIGRAALDAKAVELQAKLGDRHISTTYMTRQTYSWFWRRKSLLVMPFDRGKPWPGNAVDGRWRRRARRVTGLHRDILGG